MKRPPPACISRRSVDGATCRLEDGRHMPTSGPRWRKIKHTHKGIDRQDPSKLLWARGAPHLSFRDSECRANIEIKHDKRDPKRSGSLYLSLHFSCHLVNSHIIRNFFSGARLENTPSAREQRLHLNLQLTWNLQFKTKFLAPYTNLLEVSYSGLILGRGWTTKEVELWSCSRWLMKIIFR